MTPGMFAFERGGCCTNEPGDVEMAGTGSGRRYPEVSLAQRARYSCQGRGPLGNGSHPALFLWCDGSSPNPISSLEMASETLVAMVILNSSDSDVALLWQPHPQPLGGSADFSLIAEKGSEAPFCSLLAAVQ